MCNENHQPQNGSYYTPNNKRKTENGKSKNATAAQGNGQNNPADDEVVVDRENTAESYPVNMTATKLMMAPLCVSKKDRNKFCGSLPNHLDADDDVCCGDNGMFDFLIFFIFFIL